MKISMSLPTSRALALFAMIVAASAVTAPLPSAASAASAAFSSSPSSASSFPSRRELTDCSAEQATIESLQATIAYYEWERDGREGPEPGEVTVGDNALSSDPGGTVAPGDINSPIRALLDMPDLGTIAVGTQKTDGTGIIEVYDTTTWSRTYRLESHPQLVISLARYASTAPGVLANALVSGSDDGTVKMWNPSTGVLFASDGLTGHPGYNLNAVAALPDGRLVTAGTDRTIKVWEPVTYYPGNAGAAWALQSTLSALSSGTDTLSGRTQTPWAMSLLSNGELAVGSGRFRGTLHYFDVSSNPIVQIASVTADTRNVYGISETTDGDVVTVGNEGIARLWDSTSHSATALSNFAAQDAGTIGYAVHALDNGVIAVGGQDLNVRLFAKNDDGNYGLYTSLTGATRTIRAVTSLADGRVVAGAIDSNLLTWDVIDPPANVDLFPTSSGSSNPLAVLGAAGDPSSGFESADKDSTAPGLSSTGMWLTVGLLIVVGVAAIAACAVIGTAKKHQEHDEQEKWNKEHPTPVGNPVADAGEAKDPDTAAV